MVERKRVTSQVKDWETEQREKREMTRIVWDRASSLLNEHGKPLGSSDRPHNRLGIVWSGIEDGFITSTVAIGEIGEAGQFDHIALKRFDIGLRFTESVSTEVGMFENTSLRLDVAEDASDILQHLITHVSPKDSIKK